MIGEQALLADDTLAFDDQPRDVLAREAADEQVTAPRREQLAGVERHPGRRDDRVPVIQRLFHALLLRDAFADRLTAVLEPVRDRRPTVVLALARDIDLVAAARAVLDFPELAGLGMERGRLDVAVPVRPDLRQRVLLTDERIVVGHAAVGVNADDLAERALEHLRLQATGDHAALAGRDEQRAVAREYQTRTEVLRRREVWLHAPDHFHVV